MLFTFSQVSNYMFVVYNNFSNNAFANPISTVQQQMLKIGRLIKVRRGNLERSLHLAPQTRTNIVKRNLWGPLIEDPTKFSLNVCSGLRGRRKSSFQVTP